MIAEQIKSLIKDALKNLGVETKEILLEHPVDLTNGDYSTNVAMVYKVDPEKIKEELEKNLPKEISKIEIKNRFINFYLSPEFFVESLGEILEKKEKFGESNFYTGKKIIVEYTDPNPFKEFHIGHLMSNTIGEAISRVIAASGAEVKRVCYQGDVGLHVAKAVWAYTYPDFDYGTTSEIGKWGMAYKFGAKAYEQGEQLKKEIEKINKKIYDKSDEGINKIYDLGKKNSLEYFETIYQRLGTKFDFYFFESESGNLGKEIVEKNVGNVFEKSEGAIIFRGEKVDPSLHTRVFINKEGLPTYEAKELGLAKIKYGQYPYTNSIVITGNEVNDYFRVLLEAMEQVFPDLAEKTKHISHGMLRLPSGKMSSRTGDVVTAESLLKLISEKVVGKIKETNRGDMGEGFVNQVAVAALKYSILKNAIGGDIIYDFDKSISFEGDSGPYLQYSYARAKSILEKAGREGVIPHPQTPSPYQGEGAGGEVNYVSCLLYRFPEIVLRSAEEFEPHHVTTYLIDLARAFNTFYGSTKILDKDDPASPYKVALTEAFSIVIKNGLQILGIEAPEKM